MRSILNIVCLVIIVVSNQVCAQTDSTTFKTMSFFYVDNSSNAKHASLSKNAMQLLKDKLKLQYDLKDNYFYFFGADGSKPLTQGNKQISLQQIFGYLNQASDTASYDSDNKLLQSQFAKSQVKINDTLNVFLFLSYNAVNRMVTQLNDMPTPAVFPTELSTYINRDKIVRARIFILTDKDVKSNYTTPQLIRCFRFNDNDTYIQPIMEYK